MGTFNSYPDIRFGTTRGYTLARATSFKTSPAVNYMVLRSINRLIVQSGSGGYGILIETSNNVSCSGNLTTGATSHVFGGGLRWFKIGRTSFL
jgi:hypothetical protein